MRSDALLEHFPDLDFDPRNVADYNAGLIDEIERARDFIFLHYALNRRDDSDFWRQLRVTRMPDSLHERVEIYRATGRVRTRAGELFSDLSWFYVLEGMGVQPRAYDPLLDIITPAHFREIVSRIGRDTAAGCRGAIMHDQALPAGVGVGVSVRERLG